jgi:hypothetical protein
VGGLIEEGLPAARSYVADGVVALVAELIVRVEGPRAIVHVREDLLIEIIAIPGLKSETWGTLVLGETQHFETWATRHS